MEVIAKFIPSKADSEADLPLSVSKVKTFQDCKAKYRYSYIEKLPRKEWDFHIFGKFLHDVLENFHKELMQDAEQPWHTLMGRCFKEATTKYNMTAEQKSESKDILQSYLGQMAEQKKTGTLPKVIDVEREFYIDINNKVLLNGFIDRIQIDSDGTLHVADYKTTKNKKYLKDFFQLLTYAYVIMLDDPSIERIKASYILLRHDFEYLTEIYKRPEVLSIADRFLKYADNIQAERLWRPTPQFLCKYCDFVDVCDEGKQFLIKRGVIKEQPYGLSKW